MSTGNSVTLSGGIKIQQLTKLVFPDKNQRNTNKVYGGVTP